MSALTLGPAVMFTPADRPERYATALERADAVILDLEDAVTPDARPAARWSSERGRSVARSPRSSGTTRSTGCARSASSTPTHG